MLWGLGVPLALRGNSKSLPALADWLAFCWCFLKVSNVINTRHNPVELLLLYRLPSFIYSNFQAPRVSLRLVAGHPIPSHLSLPMAAAKPKSPVRSSASSKKGKHATTWRCLQNGGYGDPSKTLGFCFEDQPEINHFCKKLGLKYVVRQTQISWL